MNYELSLDKGVHLEPKYSFHDPDSEIDRQKPSGGGKLRPCEDRSGREQGLIVAGKALIPSDRQ